MGRHCARHVAACAARLRCPQLFTQNLCAAAIRGFRVYAQSPDTARLRNRQIGMSSQASHAAHTGDSHKTGLGALVLGAIGVVFGDIGTSPLYTIKEAFSPHYGLSPDHATVLGILSLVFWALMVVITIKYVAVIMRADNHGEGGIMALTALTQRTLPAGSRAGYVV